MYVQNLAFLPSYDYKIERDKIHLHHNFDYLLFKRRKKPILLERICSIAWIICTLGLSLICPATRRLLLDKWKGKKVVIYVKKDLLPETIDRLYKISKPEIEQLKIVKEEKHHPVASPEKESRKQTPSSPPPAVPPVHFEEVRTPLLSRVPSQDKKESTPFLPPLSPETYPSPEATPLPTTPITSPTQGLYESLCRTPADVWKAATYEVKEDPEFFRKMYNKIEISEEEIPESILEDRELWLEIAQKRRPNDPPLPQKWREDVSFQAEINPKGPLEATAHTS